MQVKDLMTTGISCVEEKAPLSQIARQMRQEDVGVIPVCNDKGEVLGIVTDRDLVIRALAREGDGKPSAELKAGDIMSTGLVCASPEMNTHHAAPPPGKKKRPACRYALHGRYCPPSGIHR